MTIYRTEPRGFARMIGKAFAALRRLAEREGIVIFNAPAAFFGTLALVASFTWFSMGWRYDGVVGNLESEVTYLTARIADRDEQIASLKTDLTEAKLVAPPPGAPSPDVVSLVEDMQAASALEVALSRTGWRVFSTPATDRSDGAQLVLQVLDDSSLDQVMEALVETGTAYMVTGWLSVKVGKLFRLRLRRTH